MKQILPLILSGSLLAPASGLGQTSSIDSLRRMLPSMGADTARVSLMNKLSWSFWETGQYDSTFAYATLAKGLAEQLGFHIGTAQAWNEIGLVHEYRGDYARALQSYTNALHAARLSGNAVMTANCHTNLGILEQKQGNYAAAYADYAAAMKVYTEAGNEKGMAVSYVNLGYVNSVQGNYPEALRNYYAALKIREKEKSPRALAILYTNIGIVHYRQRNFTEALKDHKAALALQQGIDNREGIATSRANIGGVLQKLGQYDQALANFREALDIDQQIGNRSGIASDHASIGEVLALQGHDLEAMDHIRTSLRISTEIGDKPGMAEGFLALGSINMHLNKPREARAFTEKALHIGLETNSKEDIKDAYRALASTDSIMGDFREALSNYKLYTLYKDSLFNEENTRELTRTAMQYEFGKKMLADSLNHVAEQRSMGTKLEQQKTLRNGALAFAALLAVGGGLWWRSDRNRRKERFHKELAELETQVLRTQMNPHFIFNALNSINAFVQQNDRDRASAYLSKFAQVMRGVLENSRHAEVSLEDDLQVLRGYLDLERLRMDGKFEYTITLGPDIDPRQVLVPPLTVQPLVENAIWHGLAKKNGPGHITLEVNRQADHLSWSVEDDGVGRALDNAKQSAPDATAQGQGKKTSLGLAITRSRLALLQQQYGGRASLRYEPVTCGTRAVVDMPLIPA